jgi:hypothetical protein
MAEAPELQGRLCHILAGVVIRACDDEDKKKKTQRVAGLFGKASLLSAMAGGKTTHSAEGDKAVSCLLQIMKEKMECNEHGGVWAAVRALHIVAQSPTGAKKILMVEGLPMIRQAYAYYRSLRCLPPAIGRKPPEEPRSSYSKPALLHSPVEPALFRKAPGVMESLRKEEALANPTRKQSKRKTLLDMIGDDDASELADADQGSNSLLALLKEDEVEEIAFLRATDRNVMVLKLHYLERAVVTASSAMKRPFARARGAQVKRTQSIEANDMAQTADAPGFQRSMSKPDFAQGRQDEIPSDFRSRPSFMNKSASTFFDEEPEPNSLRRGFTREARMSFVG